MKQMTLKVERGSKGFGLSLVYRGLDHFAQVGDISTDHILQNNILNKW